MQRQLGLFCRSFIAGTVALSVFAPSSFAVPSSEYEQSFSTPVIVARGFSSNNAEAMAELELTAAQKAEIAAIQENVISQMSEILTAEQMQSFKDSRASGDTSDVRRIMMSLSRSDRSSVKDIISSAEAAVMDVLTEEQQEKLENYR